MKSQHLVLALVVLALGCGKKEAPPALAKGAAPATAATAGAPAEPPSGPSSERLTVRGVVEETFDASDYTYMRLRTADGELWAATGKSVVKKGETVTVVNAARMDGFESKTLNRRFDRIVFGNLAALGEAAPAPMASGHAPADADVREQMKSQHAAAASGPADVGKIEVKKAEGANGWTVAELYARKATLKDREVAVRGKVVKFTGSVMGRNWVHLRDGSGTREGKDDDVTVTTGDVAAVGDVVLATGTLRLDRDFGAGYTYPVLVENAKLGK